MLTRIHTVTNRISVGFLCGGGVFAVVHTLWQSVGFESALSECADSAPCATTLLLFRVDITLFLALAFGVGIGKSLIDALRDIRCELARLEPLSTQEEPQ